MSLNEPWPCDGDRTDVVIMPRHSIEVDVRIAQKWGTKAVLTEWRRMPDGVWYGKVRPWQFEAWYVPRLDLRPYDGPRRPPGRGRR